MATLQLFGRTRVRAGDGEVLLTDRDFGGAKPRQILEILATSTGDVRPKEQLIDMLWGDQIPDGAAGGLESYVSVLRRRLGPQRAAVVTGNGGYALDNTVLTVDLDGFDSLVRRSHGTSTSDFENLNEAVVMAERPALESDPYANWAIEVRREYTNRVVDAHVAAAKIALARGDHQSAVSHGKRALDHDDLREDAWVVVISGYQGQRMCMQALRTYDRCRQVFRRELGAEPSGVLRELQRSLLHETGGGTAEISILVRSLVEAVRGARAGHPEIGREVLDTLTAELARQGIVAT